MKDRSALLNDGTHEPRAHQRAALLAVLAGVCALGALLRSGGGAIHKPALPLLSVKVEQDEITDKQIVLRTPFTEPNPVLARAQNRD